MDISKRERIMILVILVLLSCNIYLLYDRALQGHQVIGPEEVEKMFAEEEQQQQEVVVHVTGQVKNKGIVCLEEGCRVMDAVQAAGGPTDKADLDRINLARVLVDGERIYVPAIGEEVDNSAAGDYNMVGDGKININTADVSDMEKLPGIGPVLARRIVEFREKEGSFKRPEDIMKVSGIGPKIYEGIKDSITVR